MKGSALFFHSSSPKNESTTLAAPAGTVVAPFTSAAPRDTQQAALEPTNASYCYWPRAFSLRTSHSPFSCWRHLKRAPSSQSRVHEVGRHLLASCHFWSFMGCLFTFTIAHQNLTTSLSTHLIHRSKIKRYRTPGKVLMSYYRKVFNSLETLILNYG